MTTLDREHVLDELEVLATIEHALIVEHLSICCALGHDLEAEDGGPTTDRGREAATAASLLAQNEMFHFKGINRALVSSGRSARLDRAEGIPNTSGQVLPVPPDQAGLEQLLEREKAMATAVDERYIRLAPAVTTHPVFEAEVLDEWRTVILDSGPTHVGALTGLQSALQGLAPTEFLRATPTTFITSAAGIASVCQCLRWPRTLTPSRLVSASRRKSPRHAGIWGTLRLLARNQKVLVGRTLFARSTRA